MANYVDLESGFKTSVDEYFKESRQNLLTNYNENKKALEDLYEPLKTNYANMIQNYQNLYTPMANQYISERSAYKTQANYDISQAYANYKKQQLNLLQSQRLGTGFKENVSSILKSNYGNLFRGIKKEEAQNLADLEQAYLKKVASNAETIYGLQEDYEKKKASIGADIESLTTAYNKDLASINKEASDYASKQYKLTRKLFDFAMENGNEIDDWLNEKQKKGLYTDLSKEDVFLKWMEDRGYLSSTVNTDTMSEDWELTDYGKDYLAQQLFKTNSKGELFRDYLAREDEDLYNFYQEKDETGALTNQTMLKDLLGLYTEKDGQRVYDMRYDAEQGLNRRLTSDNYIKDYSAKNAPTENPFPKNIYRLDGDEYSKVLYKLADTYYEYGKQLGITDKTAIFDMVEAAVSDVNESVPEYSVGEAFKGIFDRSREKQLNDLWKKKQKELNEQIKQFALDKGESYYAEKEKKKAEEKAAKEKAEAEKKAKEEAERNKTWSDKHFEQSQEMLRKQGNDALADYLAEERSKFDFLKPKTFR